MLALAGINALGFVLFVAIYLAAAVRSLSQGGFLVGLVVLAGAITALWVRVERKGAGPRGFVERLGRAVGGLALVALLGPVAVLMPLFALQPQIPEEAGADRLIGRLMVLVLASLALIGLCNVAGAIYQFAAALFGRLSRPRGR